MLMNHAAPLLLLLAAACATAPQGGIGSAPSGEQPLMPLDRATTQVDGWLSAKGEWMLFGQPDFKAYNPYPSEEDRKCIALVNGTGRPRADFLRFDGDHVRVTGEAVAYDDLPTGSDAHSQIMNRKSWNGETVFNYCLRDLVFIARSIEATDPPAPGTQD